MLCFCLLWNSKELALYILWELGQLRLIDSRLKSNFQLGIHNPYFNTFLCIHILIFEKGDKLNTATNSQLGDLDGFLHI